LFAAGLHITSVEEALAVLAASKHGKKGKKDKKHKKEKKEKEEKHAKHKHKHKSLVCVPASIGCGDTVHDCFISRSAS